MENNLSENVVLITGAASGLGAAMAEAFGRAKAYVVVTDLDENGALAVAQKIIDQGGSAEGVALDVTNPELIDQVIGRIYRERGRLDVVISNAGIQIIAPIEQLAYAQWKKMVTIHLDAAYLLTHAALPIMYRQKRGKILYIGSVHSKEASPLKAPYVSAKHALAGLCKVVAREGGPHGVGSALICPGFVKTPLVDRQIPEQAKELGISEERVIKEVMLKETVDGKFTTMEEVANVALFLASFPTLALTGQSFIVSHGWCMD